ncbi:FUSC family protein [Massilia sp. 2TAF26]|uniref:FUSC family protein n=1 Tax=Massilia sp. 2TAF26 TaxID=3233012 RepID=UPI003F9C2793
MHRAHHLFAYLLDLFLASDPALERLRSGLRALLTAAILAALFLLVPRLLGLKYELTLAGILVAVIAAVALQDPGRKQQQRTMAWVPFLASAILVLGSLVGDHPWLSGGCFLIIIFAAFQARRFGPRGSGLGALAYQSYFYALLLKTPPDKAQWLPLFVLVGCAVAYAIRFWLVPEHPGRMLHSELRAWRARVRALLHDLAGQLEQGKEAGCKRIEAQLERLNAQSLGLETRLADFACDAGRDGGPADRLRGQVLRGELAAEALAAVVRAAARAGAGERQVLANRLRTLERSPGGDAAAAADDSEEAGAALPAALRWRLEQALRVLACLPSPREALPPMRDERKPPPAEGADKKADDKDEKRSWFDHTTRRALQACAAALGAIVAGRALSPSHWYWAVFAAFVVFTRTVTIGQTLSGAWRQVLATVVGVCVGIAAAELVHGNRTVELVLLFAFVGSGFYAFRGLQNVYVVLLSAMLAMLYELMGMNSPGLLILRLEETLIGAAAAVLSASLVLPVHTRDESRGKSAELLRAAGRLLRAAWADPDSPPRHEEIRELDRKLQALRQTLGPVTGAEYPGSKKHRRQHLRRLSRIAYCVRHCCDLVVNFAPQLTRLPALHAAARALAPRLEQAAALFEEPERRDPPDAEEAIRPQAGDAIPSQLAARWLTDIDDTLRALRAETARPDKP